MSKGSGHEFPAQKVRVVAGIATTDRAAFTNALHGPITSTDQLSDSTLRFMLIPDRLLLHARDPQHVKIIFSLENDETGILNAFVVEERKKPVSNLQDFQRWLQNVYRRGASPQQPPSNVDEMHVRYSSHLFSGEISTKDQILLGVEFTIEDDMLVVMDYADRSDLRGKGIGTAFFNRLEEAARAMGLRAIVGNNFLPNDTDQGNAGFFINKLDRYPITRIKPEYRDRFGGFSESPEEIEVVRTIKFLYDEDIREMVIDPERPPSLTDITG